MTEITSEQRSAMMAAIRSKGTKPELVVRRLLHGLGYRYRLHQRGLPGSPDIVFPSKRKVIFIHGCFWHRHTCKTGNRPVKTRPEYWEAKFARNRARDKRNDFQLNEAGWDSLTLWECELGMITDLVDRLAAFLGPSRRYSVLMYREK